MSDLILCLNFIDSKKNNQLTIDTFSGKIPNLKSKQFSGPLKKININELNFVDNLTNNALKKILSLLNSRGNIQINKYQYLIHKNNIYNLLKRH